MLISQRLWINCDAKVGRIVSTGDEAMVAREQALEYLRRGIGNRAANVVGEETDV